nr:MAG: ORF1 [TTV-like mini virus]UGV42533.1 MAG: ORF1 [TTV-like mini virus]
MPFYYRRNYWRPYRRNYWRRRTRRTFRKRFRRRRVRHFFKRKLKRLKLTQWQPQCIRLSKIKGLICSLICNKYRITHNFMMYENSWCPEHLPQGGGFSFIMFNLSNLYDEHQNARNVWTKSNNDLPLCRYLGCTLTLYQSDKQDYLFRYINSYPMDTNKLSYTSTQPNILQMLSNTVRVPSKQTLTKKKPYIKIRIPPPTQLENKWYFQQEISKIPLLVVITSATSFDNYYSNHDWMNNNITIKSLNTKIFQNKQFNKRYDKGYHIESTGTITKYLYTTRQEKSINELQTEDIIFLGDTQKNTPGEAKVDIHAQAIQWTTYKQNHKNYWGNPFWTEYLTGEHPIFQSTQSFEQLLAKDSDGKQKVGNDLTQLTNPLIIDLRYNPNKDNGHESTIYITSNSAAQQGWTLPDNPQHMLQGFSMWLATWGFEDYIKKIKILQQVDEGYMIAYKNSTTKPLFQDILPLDNDFINGHSPFEQGPNVYDKDKWYPQLQFQQNSLNAIAACGPGTPKFNRTDNEYECKFKYQFYFKFGGNPKPMEGIHDPKTQPSYPTPNNIQQTTSLQNPATPIENYLQSFDWRRDILTDPAIERIIKDFSSTKYSVSDGTTHPMDTETPKAFQTFKHQTPEEEKEEETLYQQLQQQRIQQLQLRQRIIQTMQQIQNLE